MNVKIKYFHGKTDDQTPLTMRADHVAEEMIACAEIGVDTVVSFPNHITIYGWGGKRTPEFQAAYRATLRNAVNMAARVRP